LKEKCNGCDGTGIKAEWPTQWKYHDGDVMPVAQLTEDSAGFMPPVFRMTYQNQEEPT